MGFLNGQLASYISKLLMYDSLDGRFLTVKLRPRQLNCAMCGDSPTIDKLQDYEQFCGASATDKVRICRCAKQIFWINFYGLRSVFRNGW